MHNRREEEDAMYDSGGDDYDGDGKEIVRT